jgi:3-hydroxyisobutyrate dehydrogenase-like beta-hydroxyacid dehydrogenase
MAEGVRSPVLGELSLMLKDLTMVEEVMRQHGRDLPLIRVALEVYRRAAREGLLREDLAALSTLYLGPRHPRGSKVKPSTDWSAE